MPLPFAHVCDLLEQCSKLCAAREKYHPAVVNWFNRHRALIDAHDTDVAALLSTLLPEKRTDRVYCIQAASLEKIIGRALMLGSSRIKGIWPRHEAARPNQPPPGKIRFIKRGYPPCHAVRANGPRFITGGDWE